ncbi:MAG: HlyC/CorC family transporter, partial [Anaerotignum sp.]|nr:HlyC/CorC family transporter [Anaerotignum sp.]
LDTIVVITITLVLSYFTLVLGELVPKRIAMRHAEGMARLSVSIIAFLSTILKPIVWFLTVSTNTVLRLFRIDPNEESNEVSEEDILDMIDEGKEQGTIGVDAGTLIENVFAFDDVTADEVLIPRTQMAVISVHDSKETIIQTIKSTGFSRIPVYGVDLDDIVGILYVKDIFFLDEDEFSAETYMREPLFTYESKPIAELLTEMKTSRLGVAIVLDEYGGTSGLVTMEDMVEEIVGEIEDEYDDDEEDIEFIKENEFVVDGSTRLEDFNEMMEMELCCEEVDTIAGYILVKLGNFPVEGQELETDGLRIVVEEMDKRRIEKVHIYKIEEEKELTEENNEA